MDLTADEFEEPKRSRRALRNTFLGFCSLALVSIKMLVIKLERNEAHDLSVSSIQDTDTSNDYKMAHEQPRAVRFTGRACRATCWRVRDRLAMLVDSKMEKNTEESTQCFLRE